MVIPEVPIIEAGAWLERNDNCEVKGCTSGSCSEWESDPSCVPDVPVVIVIDVPVGTDVV